MNRLTQRLLFLSLAAFAVTVLAPHASAIDTLFTINGFTPPAAVQADLGSEKMTLDWTYSLAATGTESIGLVASTTILQWEPPTCIDDNAGVTISGTLSQSIVLSSGTEPPKKSVTGKSDFFVSASLQAPGERQISCTFKGKVLAPGGGANQQISDSNTPSVSVPMLVKYLGLLTAEVPSGTIQEAGPQKEIRFDIKLTNLGNSISNVKFSMITDETSADAQKGWLPLPPPPATVGSLQQGSPTNTVTVPFQITTPYHNGWNNGESTFQLRIAPESTKDQTAGTEIVIPVNTRVRGIYVPGPEPMLLVGALLGAALVARLVRAK